MDKGEKRSLREIIPSIPQETQLWQVFLGFPVPTSSTLQMDITAAQALGLRLAAESGGLTQSAYDFGITHKDGSLLTFPRTEETLYTYNKLPSQLEGKVHFFPSPQGPW